MKQENVNSKNYWENRFLTDWDKKQGPDQSRFFARVTIENLPDWFKRLVTNEKLSICDWGCAAGDGTDLLASCLGRALVSGVDLSPHAIKTANSRYSDLKFMAEDWTTKQESTEKFDAIFSSNTLEHFQNPFEILEQLAAHARQFIILTLPYRELERDSEHFFTFLSGNIPFTTAQNFSLVHSRVIDTRQITPNYWYGEQIVLIYANQTSLSSIELNLNSINITSEFYEDKLSKLSTAYKDKELAITYLKQADFEKGIKLNDVSTQLQKQTASHTNLSAQLAFSEETHQKFEQSLESRTQELATVSQELESVTQNLLNSDAEKIHLMSEIKLMKVSRSWRWTAPLRADLQAPTIPELRLSATRLIHLTKRYWVLLKRDGFRPATQRANAYLRFKLATRKAGTTASSTNSSEDQIDTSYNPYSYIDFLKSIKVHAINKSFPKNDVVEKTPFSIITTLLNEAEGVSVFIESLAHQTLIPDEIIIVDGGSTDGTIDLIETASKTLKLSVKLIASPGCSIAAGRNIAIAEAIHPFIIVVDAGCHLDKNLCNNLVGVFSDYPDADLVGGVYQPTAAAKSAHHFVPEWSTNDWQRFLPSSRNLLIRKEIWEKTGGYPEFLSKTGEDTLFDISYRRHSKLWIFNQAAFVHWNGPSNMAAALKLAESYGYGDGESGFGDERFYPDYKHYVASKELSAKNSIISAMTAGYLDGRQHRASKEISGRDLKGLVIILSGVPITDSGGGQRGAQLALEFARRNFKVIYANIYPSFEAPHKIHFNIDMTLIELYQLNDIDLLKILDDYDALLDSSLILLEFPHPEFISPIQEIKQRQRRPKIVYDYIDNWNSTLGWTWYSQELENTIIAEADCLTASAQTLKEELSSRTEHPVALIPNAFNANLFNPNLSYLKPSDMPTGYDQIILYIGALWGEWFDWDLLNAAATALPQSVFVLIGNSSSEIEAKVDTDNVLFLGLKAQTELPAYLVYSDKCIIPFKTDKITKYVNPLKVYEYLAMLKPVITTEMEELHDLTGVKISNSKEAFILNLQSPPMGETSKNLDELLALHSWQTRADSLIKLVNKASQQK